MNTIHYVLTGESLNIFDTKNNESRTYTKDQENYKVARQAILTQDADGIQESLGEIMYGLKKAIEPVWEGCKVVDEIVYIDNNPLPTLLGKRLIGLGREGKSYKFVIDFWERLQRNPSYNSIKCLFDFMEHNHLSFYEGDNPNYQGCVVGYKAITNDFKDKYSGKLDYSLGTTVEVPRNQVDDDVNHDCSNGIHVGSLEYARDYAKGNDRLVSVICYPEHVVSVPPKDNYGKMRVCKMTVLEEIPRDFSDHDHETWDGSKDYWDEDDEDQRCDGCDFPLEDCECDEHNEADDGCYYCGSTYCDGNC